MQKHGKKSLSGDILRDFGDIIKWNNIHIMGIPVGNDKGSVIGNVTPLDETPPVKVIGNSIGKVIPIDYTPPL